MTSEQIRALVQLSERINGELMKSHIPFVGDTYISRINLTDSLFRIEYPLYSVDLQGDKDIPSNDLPNLRYMYNEYLIIHRSNNSKIVSNNII